jgi:hypothetical protein
MRNRRLIAGIGIAVLFAVAMAPLTSLTALSGASIAAILVPLPALFGAVVSVPLAAPEPVQFPASHVAAPLPSRAPPPA